MKILAGMLCSSLTATRLMTVKPSYSGSNNIKTETNKLRRALEAEVKKAMDAMSKYVSERWGERAGKYLFNQFEDTGGASLMLWSDDFYNVDGVVRFRLGVTPSKNKVWCEAWHGTGPIYDLSFNYNSKAINFKDGADVGAVIFSIFSDKKKWKGTPPIDHLREVADRVGFLVNASRDSDPYGDMNMAMKRLDGFLRSKLNARFAGFTRILFQDGALYGIGEEVDGKVPMVSLFLGDDFKSVCLSVSVVDQTSGKAVYGSFVSSTAGDFLKLANSFTLNWNWVGPVALSAESVVDKFVRHVNKSRYLHTY